MYGPDVVTGQRYVEAPSSTDGIQHTGNVLSVLLDEDEEVEWLWTHEPERSYVSGYIMRKLGCITCIVRK